MNVLLLYNANQNSIVSVFGISTLVFHARLLKLAVCNDNGKMPNLKGYQCHSTERTQREAGGEKLKNLGAGKKLRAMDEEIKKKERTLTSKTKKIRQ